MNHLPTKAEILRLHQRILAESGGMAGLRDVAALESALAQPEQTFDGQALYPGLIDKVSALGFFLIRNHPFIDGNKRIGQATMEVTLLMNDLEIRADLDEQEQIILAVAAGRMAREPFAAWMRSVVVPRFSPSV